MPGVALQPVYTLYHLVGNIKCIGMNVYVTVIIPPITFILTHLLFT